MDIVLFDGDCLRFEDHSIYKSAFQQFERIRNHGKFCDVTLKCEGLQFSAHKIVLAASIPYFNGMFMNDMAETDEKNIVLQGLDASALETLINFAYRGEVFITLSNVQSIFLGSNFLQIVSVRNACCDFMRKRISVQSVLPLRSFAKSLFCPELQRACEQFALAHFMRLLDSEELSEVGWDELAELLSRDELQVDREETVFAAAMRWVEFQGSGSQQHDDRLQHLPALLRLVRLPQVDRQFLLDTVCNHQLIQTSLSCRNVVDATKDFLILPKQIKNLEPHNFRPRCLQNSMYGFIFALGSSSFKPSNSAVPGIQHLSMEVYHPILRQWACIPEFVSYRTRVGVAVLSDEIYLIGGFDGCRRLSTVEVFSTKRQSWSSVAGMNCSRSALGCATLDNENIYVCGGYDGVIALKSCEMFTPATNRWQLIPPMLECRSATGLVQLGSQLFAVGGHNGLAIDNSVERYDPRRRCWDFVRPMLSRRCRHGVAAFNQNIFSAGGYDGVKFLSSVEMYSPSTDQWTLVTAMKIPRSRISLISTFGELFAIGGYDGNVDLDSVESFRVNTQKWMDSCRLEHHVGGVGCGVVAFSEVHPDIQALFGGDTSSRSL